MTKHNAPGMTSAEPPRHADDRAYRELAIRVGEVFPDWLVMWGTYSRRFWAFPCFDAPPGTIAQAADPSSLAGMMHRLQRAAADGAR